MMLIDASLINPASFSILCFNFKKKRNTKMENSISLEFFSLVFSTLMAETLDSEPLDNHASPFSHQVCLISDIFIHKFNL